MKEKLLRILQNDPATAGRPSDFLDTLAEDIQAVIIRAIAPGDPDDQVAELEAAVEEVYNSDFGITFFNLFSTSRFPGKLNTDFSGRKRAVRAAIQTLLVEQSLESARQENAVTIYHDDVPPTSGPTLKRRLREMHVAPTTTTIN